MDRGKDLTKAVNLVNLEAYNRNEFPARSRCVVAVAAGGYAGILCLVTETTADGPGIPAGSIK